VEGQERPVTESDAPNSGTADVPPGTHPLEEAARRGIGPLSSLGQEVWHGEARPCVSCGHLVLRDQRECDSCGQDLCIEMIEKMRVHAGPWDVFEHLHPFPGVSLERVIRQIRRGIVTEASIVRGPATDFQWRFAVETPGLCRYFGRCWNCHGEASPSDTYCSHCLEYLSIEKPKATSANTPDTADTDSQSAVAEEVTTELRELSAVIGEGQLQRRESIHDEPPRIAGVRATWVALAIIAVVIASLLFVVQMRNSDHVSSSPALSPTVTQ